MRKRWMRSASKGGSAGCANACATSPLLPHTLTSATAYAGTQRDALTHARDVEPLQAIEEKKKALLRLKQKALFGARDVEHLQAVIEEKKKALLRL